MISFELKKIVSLQMLQQIPSIFVYSFGTSPLVYLLYLKSKKSLMSCGRVVPQDLYHDLYIYSTELHNLFGINCNSTPSKFGQ